MCNCVCARCRFRNQRSRTNLQHWSAFVNIARYNSNMTLISVALHKLGYEGRCGKNTDEVHRVVVTRRYACRQEANTFRLSFVPRQFLTLRTRVRKASTQGGVVSARLFCQTSLAYRLVVSSSERSTSM